MIRTHSKIASASSLLYRDCQELARALLDGEQRTERGLPWSYNQIARATREAGHRVTDPLVRHMEKPGWRPSLDTLLKIEATFSGHPAWPGRYEVERLEISNPTGFILRRARKIRGGRFQDLAAVWESGDTRALERDTAVSLTSIIGPWPQDFKIARHSPQVIEATGTDKSGQRLGENRSSAYAKGVWDDYANVHRSGRPMLMDIVWHATDNSEGRHYTRLLLPMGALIGSYVEVHNPRFSGDMAYSANICS